MSKNVQISRELFLQLCKYHLAGFTDDTDAIVKGLSDKLDSLVIHELYSKYKDKSLSPEERNKARLEYLDKKGIPKDFRW